MAEEFFFFVHHALRHVHEIGDGIDVFAAEAKLRRLIERTGSAHFDGGVDQFEAAQNDVVELQRHPRLGRIVADQLAELREIVVNAALHCGIFGESRFVSRILVDGARAGGVGERGLQVAEANLNFVAMRGPFCGANEARNGDCGCDAAAEEKNQRGEECEPRFLSRRHALDAGWKHD